VEETKTLEVLIKDSISRLLEFMENENMAGGQVNGNNYGSW